MSSSSEDPKIGASCEITDNIDILRQVNFFSGLPLEVVKLFAYLCTRENFRAGDFIFHQGDDDGCAYFTLTGEVDLLIKNDGTEATLRRYPEGSFFGSFKNAKGSVLFPQFPVSAFDEFRDLSVVIW